MYLIQMCMRPYPSIDLNSLVVIGPDVLFGMLDETKESARKVEMKYRDMLKVKNVSF